MIKFTVVNNNNSYELSEEKLLELLLKACTDNSKEEERKGSKELASSLSNLILDTKFILNHSIGSLIELSFKLGFYYARFLERNKVIISEVKNGS